MTLPDIGSTYRYQAEHALGQLHRVQDPDVDDAQPTDEERQLGFSGYTPGAQMPDLHPDGPRAALDLPVGAQVTVSGFDEDRGLMLFEWTDQFGNPRTTSIEPDRFAELFEEV